MFEIVKLLLGNFEFDIAFSKKCLTQLICFCCKEAGLVLPFRRDFLKTFFTIIVKFRISEKKL
jgi:hypothetical protein